MNGVIHFVGANSSLCTFLQFMMNSRDELQSEKPQTYGKDREVPIPLLHLPYSVDMGFRVKCSKIWETWARCVVIATWLVVPRGLLFQPGSLRVDE